MLPWGRLESSKLEVSGSEKVEPPLNECWTTVALSLSRSLALSRPALSPLHSLPRRQGRRAFIELSIDFPVFEGAWTFALFSYTPDEYDP